MTSHTQSYSVFTTKCVGNVCPIFDTSSSVTWITSIKWLSIKKWNTSGKLLEGLGSLHSRDSNIWFSAPGISMGHSLFLYWWINQFTFMELIWDKNNVSGPDIPPWLTKIYSLAVRILSPVLMQLKVAHQRTFGTYLAFFYLLLDHWILNHRISPTLLPQIPILTLFFTMKVFWARVSWFPLLWNTLVGYNNLNAKITAHISTPDAPLSTKSPLNRYWLLGDGNPLTEKMVKRSLYY